MTKKGGGRAGVIGKVIVSLLLLTILSCWAPEPYKIGFLGGLTGGLSSISIAARNGVILAIEEANRTGGLADRKVELLIKDDRNDPETALQGMEYFVRSRAVGVIGPMTSELSRVTAPLSEKNKMVMISPFANSADFTDQGEFFFRISPTDRDEARHLADLSFRERGYRRISILYDLTNREYTENRAFYFRDFIEALGGTIVQVTSYTTRDDTDFGLLTTQASQNNPDVVYILADGSDLVRICRQLKKRNHDLPVLATGMAITPELLKQGGAAVNGIEFFQSFDFNSTAVVYQRFLDDYKNRFHEEPELGAFYAFESAKIMLTALEQARAKRNLNDIIHEIKDFKGLQETLEINQYGAAERTLVHKRIDNGAIVTIGGR